MTLEEGGGRSGWVCDDDGRFIGNTSRGTLIERKGVLEDSLFLFARIVSQFPKEDQQTRWCPVSMMGSNVRSACEWLLIGKREWDCVNDSQLEASRCLSLFS